MAILPFRGQNIATLGQPNVLRLSSFRSTRWWMLLSLLIVWGVLPVNAQYFGRNKVRYENFDFQVMKTEHFDVHYYPQEKLAVADAARMAERWYVRLSDVFGHTFGDRKPIILYADQGDFQQTYVIGGEIGEGTGGFTESTKDRVVLPLTGSYAGNDHVIGHELVHAFQYDIARRRVRDGVQRMNTLPLWFIEGMAEYLSVGRNDPHTAMWIRDDLMRDTLPTLDDITSSSRYFPYRYGQAVWAYIGGRWGDGVVRRLYETALALGWERAIEGVLGITTESLSRDWHNAIRAAYSAEIVSRTRPEGVGRGLLADGENDDLNIAPSISPDGKYAIFLSSRDIFSIEYYLADVRSGRVLDKLFSSESNPHLDALRFINSAGAWSPDGRKFAFVVYESGNDRLAILDVASQDIERRIPINNVGAISNPCWSPDGSKIVFSGVSGGISDLYIYEVRTAKVTQLMNDRYAEMQPAWSPDGSTIAFVSDRDAGTDFGQLTYAPMGLSLLTVATGSVKPLTLFPGAKKINPQYSPDGKSLYFISDQDGFSDIYRLTLATGELTRLTRTVTGVTGITELSPAMSVASTSGEIAFSVFNDGNYVMRLLPPDRTAGDPILPTTGGTANARTLPPPDSAAGTVSAYLTDPRGLPADTSFPSTEYSPSLQLDHIGAPTVGAGIGANGATFVGSTSLYFSDMLGYHRVAAGLAFNGSIQDIGADVVYQYTRKRWGWGIGLMHYPYLTGGTQLGTTVIEIDSVPVTARTVDQYIQRDYYDQVRLLGDYPFNSIQRFEMSAGFTRISYTLDVQRQIIVNNRVIETRDAGLPTPPGLNLLQGSAALVTDNSFMGYTSPVKGERARAEIGGTAGSLTFGTLLLDYRRYFYLRPATFALRGMHYGRYGPDAEDERLSPLFLGYETMVRGYSNNSFSVDECSGIEGCPEYDRLFGSRIALMGMELRAPLFGPGGFGIIDIAFLPIDLGVFADAGVAWSPGQAPVLEFKRETTQRVPVFSAGFNARVNLLGYAVIEVFYAYPFQRPLAGWQLGFNISPGW